MSLKIKPWIFALLCFLSSLTSIGQINKSLGLVIDSTLTLKVGIYRSQNEFLNNAPSFLNHFEVVNNNPDYIVHKNEKNDYFLDFFTKYGTRKVLPLNDVWGYCDGTGVFLNYEGKPYQLIYLGAISILRYEKTYYKNKTSQFLTYVVSGNTVTSIEQGVNAFYSIKEDRLFPYEEKHLNNIILQESRLYFHFRKDTRKNRWRKRLHYISELNKLHPIIITESDIKID